MQRQGIWEDDITRDLVVQQQEQALKQAHLELSDRVKEGNFSFKDYLYPPEPSTVIIEEIQDSQPLALENSAQAPAQTVEDETDTETDVDSKTEPPPCPVSFDVVVTI